MEIFTILVVVAWCILISYTLISFRLEDFKRVKKFPKWHLSAFGKLGLALIAIGSISALIELFGGSVSNDPRFNLSGSLVAYYGLISLFLDACLNIYRAWLELRALDSEVNDKSDH